MNKLALAGLLLALMQLLIWPVVVCAEDKPVPRNFGVKDDPDLPENPRDYHGRERDTYPEWDVSKVMPNDVFTFPRLRYHSNSYYRRNFKWRIDYPNSEINFSYRLQQLTSLQVNSNGAVIDIKAEQLRHYPFVYMLEVGEIDITDEEANTLREYMLNGGFIMVDDFWGSREWDGWMKAYKKIFPDRMMKELTIEHDIFHIVFDIKKIQQIPGIGWFYRGYEYEADKPNSEGSHYYGVYDDKNRMVMIICHNTDHGDSWEEEGSNPDYFHQYSEKYGYPIGINIVFYALTH
jgi:hypothetical protein